MAELGKMKLEEQLATLRGRVEMRFTKMDIALSKDLTGRSSEGRRESGRIGGEGGEWIEGRTGGFGYCDE